MNDNRNAQVRCWIRMGWKWIGDNSQTLMAIAAIVGLFWVVFAFLIDKRDDPKSEFHIKDSPNSNINVQNINAGGDVNVGISFEQHRAELEEKERALLEAIHDRSTSDERRRIAEIELAAVKDKLADTEKSLVERNEELRRTARALETVRGQVPDEKLAKALDALKHGDTMGADALFEEVASRGTHQSAAATFQRGKIAEGHFAYFDALKYYNRAAEIDPQRALYHTNVGRMLGILGNYEEAEKRLGWILSSLANRVGPDHPEVLANLCEYAIVLNSRGRMSAAEHILLDILAKDEEIGGTDNYTLACTLFTLGSIYLAKARVFEAKNAFERVLSMINVTVTPNSNDLIMTTLRLAETFYLIGDSKRAEEYYVQALAKLPQLEGRHGGLSSSVYYEVAYFYEQQSRLEEALLFAEEALRIAKHIYGDDHDATAARLNLIGMIYLGKGDLKVSEQRFQEARAIYERKLNPSQKHPNSINIWMNLAVLDGLRYQFSEQQAKLQTGIGLAVNMFGAESPRLVKYYFMLSDCYLAQANYGRAEEVLREGLSLGRRTLPEGHWWLAKGLVLEGLLLMHRQKFEEAEKVMHEGIEIMSNTFGVDHANTIIIRTNLGFLYSLQGQHDKAKDLIERSLEALKDTVGVDHPFYKQTADARTIILNNRGGAVDH